MGRTIIGAALLAVLAGSAGAGETVTIRDKDGRTTHQLTPNPVVKDSFIVRDRDGRRVGTVEPSPILKDSYVVRDRDGRRIGTLDKR